MLKFVLLLAALLASAGCVQHDGGERINGTVSVAAGQSATDASTVNGAIHVAPDAAVLEATTVNGSITLGDRATATSAATVNGGITVGALARVAGDVTTVNGALTLKTGADVQGDLQNVNGRITLEAAHLGGGIETVAGDITVGADARVDGGIAVRKPQGFSISFSKNVPVIVIGPGAMVKGPLKFEREVKLLVSDRATIGPVSGATPVSFAGDSPPV
jgi:DUF4097 and DUF4098 domain-containing protein YvlB